MFTSTPFAARHIRFQATKSHNDKCARLEYYGCPYVCPGGLGIESGTAIPDDVVISASNEKTLANNGRLNHTTAWCSSTSDVNQFLSVDLGQLATITGIAVQGHPTTDYWVQQFYIRHGISTTSMATYQQNGTDKIFIGNNDSTTIVVNWFLPKFTARIIRIKPESWKIKICMRIEIMGCRPVWHESLGVENKIVLNGAMDASSFYVSGYEASSARLNNLLKPWCAQDKPQPAKGTTWLEVDLGNVFLVTGVASQGDPSWSLNYWTELKLKYSFDGSNFAFVKEETNNSVKVFDANTNNVGVAINNIIFSAKYVRFYPAYSSYQYCLRVEIYGRPQFCIESFGMVLGSSSPTGISLSASSGSIPHANATLNSGTAWCATTLDLNQNLQIDIGKKRTISGIAIQGDPTSDKWVKKFQLKYGDSASSLKTYKTANIAKTFTGSSSRNEVVLNWLESPFIARYIQIRPKSWETGGICLRVNFYGCPSSDCSEKLGLESGVIPNSALSLSSSIPFNAGTGTDKSRLNYNSAWGAKDPPSSHPWIQVCFIDFKSVSGIILQGQGDTGYNRVTKFSIKYGYVQGSVSYEYKLNGKNIKFDGVPTRYSSVEITLPINIIAKCIRLFPEEIFGSHVFLKWELLGCNSVNPNVPETKPTGSSLTINRHNNRKLTCNVTGQPGMSVTWRQNKKVISDGGIHSIAVSTIREGDVNNTINSELTIKADLSLISSNILNCSVMTEATGKVECVSTYECQMTYKDIPKVNATGAAVEVKMIGFNGKPSVPSSLSGLRSNTSVNITWKSPLVSVDFQVTEYKIILQRTNGSIIGERRKSAPPVVFSGLHPYTNYKVTVYAIIKINGIELLSDGKTYQIQTDETGTKRTGGKTNERSCTAIIAGLGSALLFFMLLSIASTTFIFVRRQNLITGRTPGPSDSTEATQMGRRHNTTTDEDPDVMYDDVRTETRDNNTTNEDPNKTYEEINTAGPSGFNNSADLYQSLTEV